MNFQALAWNNTFSPQNISCYNKIPRMQQPPTCDHEHQAFAIKCNYLAWIANSKFEFGFNIYINVSSSSIFAIATESWAEKVQGQKSIKF